MNKIVEELNNLAPPKDHGPYNNNSKHYAFLEGAQVLSKILVKRIEEEIESIKLVQEDPRNEGFNLFDDGQIGFAEKFKALLQEDK